MKKSLFSIYSWNKYNMVLFVASFIMMALGGLMGSFFALNIVGLAFGGLLGLCILLMYKCLCLENEYGRN